MQIFLECAQENAMRQHPGMAGIIACFRLVFNSSFSRKKARFTFSCQFRDEKSAR